MARSGRSKSEMVFQHSVPVRVRRLKIQRAPSLKYLDVEKLGRAASAEFDYGHLNVNGKRSTVRAIVRKGKVVSLRHEECSDCEKTPMGPELRGLIKAIRRRIGGGGGPSRPTPVAVFLQQQQPERSECVLVCWWFACFICCGFPSDDKWDCNTVGRSSE